jgi:hypothetical protein
VSVTSDTWFVNVIWSFGFGPLFGVSSRRQLKLSRLFGAANPVRTVLRIPVKYRSLAWIGLL